jgi:hypothetical protein
LLAGRGSSSLRTSTALPGDARVVEAERLALAAAEAAAGVHRA